MNPAILNYALQIMGAIPMFLSAGQNVMTLVNHGTVAMQNMQAENRAPTEAEWKALNAIIDGLRAQLHSA